METGNPDNAKFFGFVVFAFNLNQLSPAHTSLGTLLLRKALDRWRWSFLSNDGALLLHTYVRGSKQTDSAIYDNNEDKTLFLEVNAHFINENYFKLGFSITKRIVDFCK